MSGWLGLRHVALRVSDLERSRRFYVELFGMHVEWEPDPDNVYLSSGPDNLALHRATPDAMEGPGRLDHIGFVVGRPEDVDAWAERARSHGAEIVQDVRQHRDGARSFYLRDPERNLIQILYHPPLSDPSARPSTGAGA